MITKITNGRVIRDGTVREEPLFFSEGRILPTDTAMTPDRVVDAAGSYVSPGFIDLHLHGGGGFDFMDGTPEVFRGAAEFHAKHGTTAMCPTTLSGTFEEMMGAFEAYRAVKESDYPGSDFLGLHLEGPYFALSQKGAQDEKYVRAPFKEEYERLLAATDDIVRWSAAPERDAGYEFATELGRRGIMASAGHTDADCRQMLEAADHGYTHMTHFYSCMKSVERVNGIRIAGAVEAAYLDDRITVEMIADGMHLPPELLRMIYKLKGPDKVALITDAMRGAGLPDGTRLIMGSMKKGFPVTIDRGVAWLDGGQAFAGSVATADRLVRTAVSAGIPLVDAVKMASETPAKLIGCTSKGTLAPGMDADILIFNDDIRLQNVWIRGREISL